METSEMGMVTAFVGGLVLWFVTRTQAERRTNWVTLYGCLVWCSVCVCGMCVWCVCVWCVVCVCVVCGVWCVWCVCGVCVVCVCVRSEEHTSELQSR